MFNAFAPSFAPASALPVPEPQPAAPSGKVEIKFHRKIYAVGVGYDFFIVVACLYCLYQSALDDHAALFVVAIRAALAVSEMGRAPICYLARVHSSAAWRHGLAASALLIAFITAFNLFLPFNEGMRELMREPLEARAALQAVEAGPARLRDDAARKRSDYDQGNLRVKEITDALGKLPAAHCWKAQRCQNDPRVAAMQRELAEAESAVKSAKAKVDAADKLVADAEGPKGARELRQAQDNLRHAVNRNMVFGAVATLLGTDPVKISASEMSWALRLITITVVVAAGLLGSVICLGSVERIAPAKAAPPVKARSAERIELVTAAANRLTEHAAAEVEKKIATAFRTAGAEAKAAPANDSNPPENKTPLGEALKEFWAKPKRPRGRPRKSELTKLNGNGAEPPAPPRKPQEPDDGNPPLNN